MLSVVLESSQIHEGQGGSSPYWSPMVSAIVWKSWIGGEVNAGSTRIIIAVDGVDLIMLIGIVVGMTIAEPPLRVTAARIAKERHLFGVNDYLPDEYRNLEGVNRYCAMLFPFGTFERRYQVTGTTGQMFLNCNMKRDGKIVGTWTIPLIVSKKPSARWEAGGKVFEGTLVKYVASEGLEAKGTIPKAAYKALQANKPFAGYWASLMGDTLTWWAITASGSKHEEDRRPIKKAGNVVYADGPYPITKAEREWIAGHRPLAHSREAAKRFNTAQKW
ncbi:MAG: hypothetical protein ABL949_01675 [Fimbriimonadaceae bacterium]